MADGIDSTTGDIVPVSEDDRLAGSDANPRTQGANLEARDARADLQSIIADGTLRTADPDLYIDILEVLMSPTAIEAGDEFAEIDRLRELKAEAITALETPEPEPTFLEEERKRRENNLVNLLDDLSLEDADKIRSALPDEISAATDSQIVTAIGDARKILFPEEGTDFSERDPLQWFAARDRIMEMTGLNATLAGILVDNTAREKGYNNSWQFALDEGVLGEASRLANLNDLPDEFYDENGQFYVNTVEYGPMPVSTPRPTINRNAIGIPSTALDAIEDPFERNFLNRVQGAHDIDAPVLHSSELDALKAREAERQERLGGALGGGGSRLEFDRASIEKSIREQWQHNMVEMPPDIDATVDKYIRDSRTFGRGLGLTAWTLDEMKKTARYKTLYNRKPEDVTEDDYVNRFRSVTASAGLGDAFSKAQTEIGLKSGVGQQAFATRLSNTREFQTSNLGDLSRRFADTVNSLGSLTRS